MAQKASANQDFKNKYECRNRWPITKVQQGIGTHAISFLRIVFRGTVNSYRCNLLHSTSASSTYTIDLSKR